MPKTVRIMEGAKYALDSTGNGWAYTLRMFLPERRSVWFQDDDATQFREELAALEAARPNDSPDSILGALWCDFEYGTNSRPDND
jgi:hypothetical protein